MAGRKRGKKAKRMTDAQRKYWNYPNKMVDTQKKDKASAKIETKKKSEELEKKKKELIKIYMNRYGYVPKELQC